MLELLEANKAFYKAAFDKLKPERDLGTARQRGLDLFLSEGFPIKTEAWKYSSLYDFMRKSYDLNPASGTSDKAVDYVCDQTNYRMVLVDNHVDMHLSQLPQLQGVRCTALSQLDQHELDNLASGKTPQQYMQGFYGLNQAFFSDGCYLDISDNVSLDRPLEIIQVITRPGGFHQRHTIKLGKRAKATVIQRRVILSAEAYLNSYSDVYCDEHSHLGYYDLSEGSGHLFGQLHLHQDAYSECKHFKANMGCDWIRDDVYVALAAQGASVRSIAYVYARDQQHFDTNIVVAHQHIHQSAYIQHKNILDDASQGVFDGKFWVQPGAVGTNSQMRNDNLMISKRAQMNTKPVLEIFNDDVKCAHGATIGAADDEMMFYMQSRGISRKDALKLLTHGFMAEVMDQFELDSVVRCLKNATKNP